MDKFEGLEGQDVEVTSVYRGVLKGVSKTTVSLKVSGAPATTFIRRENVVKVEPVLDLKPGDIVQSWSGGIWMYAGNDKFTTFGSSTTFELTALSTPIKVILRADNR